MGRDRWEGAQRGRRRPGGSFLCKRHSHQHTSSLLPPLFPSSQATPAQGGGSREGSGEKEGVSHPLRRGKMAPDRRSQPRAPSCQHRTDRKWQGREVRLREVAGERLPSKKTSQIITWPQVQMPPLLTPPLGRHSSQEATLTSKARKPKTNMKVIL